PAAPVTLVGTVATAVLLLARVTTAPPVGAAALKVTVPVEVLPPATVAGLRFSEERVVAGVTVSTAELLTPPYVAEIVTAIGAATGLVEIVNAALVAPAGTVTLAGTVATARSLLESGISAPPAGAAALRVTVPIEAAPPVTLMGLRFNEESVVAGVRVSMAEPPARP